MGGRSGEAKTKVNQYGSYLEKYQVEDIVDGIKVIRTKFKLKKYKGKKEK